MKRIIVVIMVILLSCHVKKDRQTVEPSDAATLMSKIEKETSYANTCKLLKIDNLKEVLQYDQIRIWTWAGLSDAGKFLELKKKNDKWSGKLHYHGLNTNERGELFVMYHTFAEGQPISNWNKYINRIEEHGIYSLSDTVRAKNYGLCNGGGTLVVEIVKDGNFSEFVYPCWDAIKDQTQIDKIKAILKETEKEFGFKIFPLEQ